MARYYLHARLFVGTLDAPTRNELRAAESDDRAELETLAVELRAAGWRVWLYERRPAQPGSLTFAGRAASFHVLGEWTPSR